VDPSHRRIGSYTTADFTLTYDTETSFNSWLANGVSIAFSVQNLFDEDPPLVVNQAGLAGSSTRFDPTYGSPLGRVLQVQLSKRF
jgi:iron complex outermembrane receptor protein